MDIKIYTDYVESHILQMLSTLDPIALRSARIYCEAYQYPKSNVQVDITLYGLVPRNRVASLPWAKEVYEALRTFPCSGGLQIKFDNAKKHWNANSFCSQGYYSNPITWDALVNFGGFRANIQATLPVLSGQGDNHVTIKLSWDFCSNV